MNFYFPYKPDTASDIKLILFLKKNPYDIHAIFLSHPNNQFEHGGLIKNLIKRYPHFRKIINIRIKNHEMIYEIANKMAIRGIATFCNASYNPYELCTITLPCLLENTQIENILSNKALYNQYENKIEAVKIDLEGAPYYLSFESNEEFYQYLTALKRKEGKQK